MAFKFVERLGIQWQLIMQSLMTDLDAIDGWTIYSNKINPLGDGYFVMQVSTSDGVGKELYVRFNRTTNVINCAIGESWDNTTNAWTTGTNVIDGQYWHMGGTPIAQELMSYRLSGDENYAIFCGHQISRSERMNPIYVGLLDKFHKWDTEPYAAVVMGRNYNSTFGPLYDDYNRNPILRGHAGNYNAYGRTCKETLFLRGNATEEFLTFGPWGPNKYIYSGAMSVWEENFGLRGHLRGVRSVSGANGTNVQYWETVLVNGDEYYWFKNVSDTDATQSRRSPWNLYDEDVSGTSHKHGLLIRKTVSA